MKATTIIAIIVLVALVHASTTAHARSTTTRWYDLSPAYTFEKYTAEFSKIYRSESEISLRRSIFQARLADILAHNSDSTATYKRGVNRFTDWTDEELARLKGYRPEMRIEKEEKRIEFEDDGPRMVAASVDWRTKGVISDVKDQGQCGSCWTFATAESVESAWAIKTGELAVLSEQQILDCTPNPNACGGNGGCEGGTPELAYQRMIDTTGGLSSEWTYPYRSYQGKDFPTCGFNESLTPVVAKVTDYKKLTPNSYWAVILALQDGPLAINVDANTWHSYESGVYTGCSTTNVDIDHVVQLVGYGTDSQYGDYWIVRNSWSPSWGEKGYIRIARSSLPNCAVDTQPSDGTGCNGGPANVTVCGECGILYDVSFPIVSE